MANDEYKIDYGFKLSMAIDIAAVKTFSLFLCAYQQISGKPNVQLVHLYTLRPRGILLGSLVSVASNVNFLSNSYI